MWTILLVILGVWLALSLIGLIVKGLFWLFVIGAILFVLTAIFGGAKRRSHNR